MTSEVKKYFYKQYKNAGFRVTYGHWPDFKTKRDVDKWIKFMEMMVRDFDNKERCRDYEQ